MALLPPDTGATAAFKIPLKAVPAAPMTPEVCAWFDTNTAMIASPTTAVRMPTKPEIALSPMALVYKIAERR